MTTDEQIGERVYMLMRRRGLTGVAAARVLGIAQPSMSKKLKGRRPFSMDEFLRICAWLDVPVDEVLREVKPAGAGGTAESSCSVPGLVDGASSLVSDPCLVAA